jgi:hypothetical protein
MTGVVGVEGGLPGPFMKMLANTTGGLGGEVVK